MKFGSKAAQQRTSRKWDLSPVSLFNKAPLLECIARCLARAKRYRGYRFSVVFLDLDGFRLVNESLGHDVGNRFLAKVTARLQGSLRAVDTLVHLGGDKYSMVLENTKEITDALRAIRRIQEDLRSPIDLDGNELYCSASMGIALFAPTYQMPEEMLRDAETAMYRAKDRGRGEYEVFDPAMHEKALRLLRLETDLHRALDRSELRLHYQPIVTIETGRIAGFEALIRWEHPERGLLYPKDFLFSAETTGLIVPINRWVLREAARQIAEWQAQFPHLPSFLVSINLSSKYFSGRELVQEISSVLSEFGLQPSNLALEITEGQIMGDPEAASKVLLEMAAMGIHVYIDDFGTGYSSLSYLTRFPVHSLKTDQSFVADLSTNEKNLSVVHAIVALGKSLGLCVIAEGVETEEQLKCLGELNCKSAQGYYFSPPLTSAAVVEILERSLEFRSPAKNCRVELV